MKRTLIFILAMYSLCTLQANTYSGTLPIMYIQTENNATIVSKDYYINATYYVDALGLTGYENLGSASAPLTMEIKGRGNYTWKDFNKKPYRLKLSDKQPLLGLTKSKHFALLAHADDAQSKKGFMRNQVGFELSRMIGMPWTPETKPVEVVLNGNYIGLYFLTETIRVDKDRVNIVEQEDNATNSEEITGGWLVEIDNYDSDPHITISEGGKHTMWFTYKTPEVLSYQQEQYLTQQMKLIDDLVYGDKNSNQLWQYLDIDALARFYIVQEIMDNYESFHGSCYLYREKGANEKWKFGPVWDFGSSYNRDKTQYLFQGDVWHNHWIPEICKFPAFMEQVKKIWKEFYPTKFNEIFTFTNAQLALLKAAAVSDANRWSEYSGNKDLQKRINNVNTWLTNSAKWLNTQWGDTENSGNNGNNGGSDYPENPDYNPSDLHTQYMCVWKNGQQVEYKIADVDSITFAQKDNGIVVKAKVPATWTETIYIYIWGDGVSGGEYEQVAMRQDDWFVFVHDGKELNIIFKQKSGWTGSQNQTENIYTTKSACYILTQEGDKKAVATQVDCP